MTIAAVDPGKNEYYLAEFDWRLVGQRPELILVGQDVPCHSRFTDLVIEKPRIYPRGHHRPNDLIDLAWAGGRVEGLFRASDAIRVTTVYPAEWKGQIKKEVQHLRILSVLSPAELACLPPETTERVRTAAEYHAKTGKSRYSWKGHNLLDAVGIGLHYVGRMP